MIAPATSEEQSSEKSEQEYVAFVCNLYNDTKGEKIKDLLSQFGDILKVERTKNFAFVFFKEESSLTLALAAKKLKVNNFVFFSLMWQNLVLETYTEN